jgi:hypothetical protein
MLKLLSINGAIAVLVLTLGIIGHDSIARAMRIQTIQLLNSSSNPAHTETVYQTFQNLGKYQPWVKASAIRAAFSEKCLALQDSLERLATTQDIPSWEIYYEEFKSNNCPLPKQ